MSDLCVQCNAAWVKPRFAPFCSDVCASKWARHNAPPPAEEEHDSGVFRECATCATKPGSPTLCPVCLHNRALVGRLTGRADRLDVELQAARAKLARYADAMAEALLRAALVRCSRCHRLAPPFARSGEAWTCEACVVGE